MSYIARWHPDAPLDYLSPQIEDLLGIPAERFIAEPELWAERLHPEDRERVLREERRSHEETQTFDREYRLVAADGCVVWVWDRDTIVRDDDGEPLHTQGILIDITARKLAEARRRTAAGRPRQLQARQRLLRPRRRRSPAAADRGAPARGPGRAKR